jgi:hypothetical protein
MCPSHCKVPDPHRKTTPHTLWFDVPKKSALKEAALILGAGDELSPKISVQSHLIEGNDVLRLYKILGQRTSERQGIWRPGLTTALSL